MIVSNLKKPLSNKADKEWTYHGTVQGTSEIAIPAGVTEILVQAEYSGLVIENFFIIANLVNTYTNFGLGSYGTTYCIVSLKTNAVKLVSFNTGTEHVNNAHLYLYAR